MASNSRQKSDSSGSKGAKGRGRVISPDWGKRNAATKPIAPSDGTSRTAPTRSSVRSAPMPSSSVSTVSNGSASVRPEEGTVRLEGQTIGSIRREREKQERQQRREAREQSRKQERRRSRLPLIIVGVTVFLAVTFLGMYYIISKTNVFEIEEINITGTEHLTAQEVRALVSIPQGTTLLNVDTAQIASSMERDAWVQTVDVNRVFPNKIEIVVHERKIGAIVEVPTGAAQSIQNWAIADDGMWLMIIPSRDTEVGSQLSEQIYADAEEATHIIDVPYGVQPQIGAYCTDANVDNALKIINGMTTELADQVRVVSAEDVEATVLTLYSNIEIAFGSADNIREKERICLQIMEEYPRVVFINVRVPDRPTWRSA